MIAQRVRLKATYVLAVLVIIATLGAASLPVVLQLRQPTGEQLSLPGRTYRLDAIIGGVSRPTGIFAVSARLEQASLAGALRGTRKLGAGDVHVPSSPRSRVDSTSSPALNARSSRARAQAQKVRASGVHPPRGSLFKSATDAEFEADADASAAYAAAQAAGRHPRMEGDGVRLVSLPAETSLMPGATIIASELGPIGTTLELRDQLRRVRGRGLMVVTSDGDVLRITGESDGRVVGLIALTLSPRVEIPGTKLGCGGRGKATGDSAGMACALAMWSAMTGIDLARGRRVVVTGAIEPDGRAREVGHAPAKTIAAARSGADLMLLPQQLVPSARPYAGSVKLVGIDSLAQAIKVLQAPSDTERAAAQDTR